MDTVSYVLLALTVVVSATFVYLSQGQVSLKSQVLKALSSFLFTLLGLYAGFLNGLSSGSLFFIIGLIASCFGDLILALPEWPELKEKKQRLIVFGGFSFAIAHTAYYVAMISTFGWSWWTLPAAVVFAAIFYFFNRKVHKIDYGKLTPGIFLYAFFVSLVLCQGLYAIAARASDAYSILLAVGFFLFYISDVVLMQIYFGGKESSRTAYNYNLSFYYAAQIMLATSLYFI